MVFTTPPMASDMTDAVAEDLDCWTERDRVLLTNCWEACGVTP